MPPTATPTVAPSATIATTMMTTATMTATNSNANDFEALGLFSESLDADCVELFADAFRDAEHLQAGEQVLLDALGEDWWIEASEAFDEADACKHKTVTVADAVVDLAPPAAPRFEPVPALEQAPVFSAPVQSSTYKSLTSQIAVIAPCFNMGFAAPEMPATHVMSSLPVGAAGQAASDFPVFDVTEMNAKARRQIAIARWKEKRKRRTFGDKHRFPEYDCRRKVANRRPRVNGRFIREQPVYVSMAELQATHEL